MNKNEIKEAFKLYDANNDGFISLQGNFITIQFYQMENSKNNNYNFYLNLKNI